MERPEPGRHSPNDDPRLLAAVRWVMPRPAEVLDDPRAPHPDEELITGPAGSVAVFNSFTWHGGTLNRTPGAHRRCLHCYFNPRHLPPQTDQRAYLRPETAQRLSPAQRYLLDLEET